MFQPLVDPPFIFWTINIVWCAYTYTHIQREGGREGERDTQRHIERERDRYSEKDRDRNRNRNRDRDRDRDRDYTLHTTPTPYTLHPTPYTLHLTPHPLHPTSYALHPVPHIRNRKLYPETANSIPKPGQADDGLLLRAVAPNAVFSQLHGRQFYKNIIIL